MSTYEVTCTSCKKQKWPTLPYRPAAYVCALCTAMSPEKRARWAEVARRQKSRHRNPQPPTEAKEETP